MSAELVKPRLLDLFCGAGGAAMGYARAGFEVVGVDCEPMPHYPFEFHQGDAFYLLESDDWQPFNAIHASPPCHDFTSLASVSGGDGTGWMLVETLRLLAGVDIPWIVENVSGAPLPKSDTLFGDYATVLCGSSFGLRVLRHRTFVASFPITAPAHGSHDGVFFSPAGHGHPNRSRDKHPELRGKGYQQRAAAAMGIDWMGRDELAEAIPPAYTEWLGGQMLNQLKVAA